MRLACRHRHLYRPAADRAAEALQQSDDFDIGEGQSSEDLRPSGSNIREALRWQSVEAARCRSQDDSTDIRAAQNRAAHDQHIHPRPQKAVERLPGLQTTGSFSLNDVFSTIGTPVRLRKLSISR